MFLAPPQKPALLEMGPWYGGGRGALNGSELNQNASVMSGVYRLGYGVVVAGGGGLTGCAHQRICDARLAAIPLEMAVGEEGSVGKAIATQPTISPSQRASEPHPRFRPARPGRLPAHPPAR